MKLNNFFRMLLAIFIVFSAPALAKNPITKYFSQLLDESRAESAAGQFLVRQFEANCPESSKLRPLQELDGLVSKLTKKATRDTLPYRILVLENPIPREIPFPDGTIILTRGVLDLIKNDEEREFVLARNIMHVSLRHPMKIIKKEALYAKILRQLKSRNDPNKEEKGLQVLGEYMKAVGGMDQIKADKEAILISENPKNSRQAAMQYLRRWEETVLPVMPWDVGDISNRLRALKTLRLK